MPLYRLRRNRGLDRRGPGRARVGVTVLLPGSERDALEMLAAADGDAVPIAGATDLLVSWPGRLERSEERRVGKEGRSRWSPDHLKKKAFFHLLAAAETKDQAGEKSCGGH